jgi:hypothetical protein
MLIMTNNQHELEEVIIEIATLQN